MAERRPGPGVGGFLRPAAAPGVGLLLATLLAACGDAPSAPDAETVVLVHGLGRTELSMALLAERLEDAGYRTVTVGYRSTEEPFDSLVHGLARELEICCAEELHGVHFVTHSLGGLVVRGYLAERSPGHEGRVVMLAPPNGGSEVVDALDAAPELRATLLGPTGSRLGTDQASIPHRLGPPDYEVGIVTGDVSLDPVSSRLIPGPDDGKVSVESARLEGAADFLVVPADHTFIMSRKDVAREVLHFLERGRFSKNGRPQAGGASGEAP